MTTGSEGNRSWTPPYPQGPLVGRSTLWRGPGCVAAEPPAAMSSGREIFPKRELPLPRPQPPGPTGCEPR